MMQRWGVEEESSVEPLAGFGGAARGNPSRGKKDTEQTTSWACPRFTQPLKWCLGLSAEPPPGTTPNTELVVHGASTVRPRGPAGLLSCAGSRGGSVLVSSCCCNKLPQTWWLTATEVYSLTVIEASEVPSKFTGLNPRYQQGCAASRARGSLFPAFSSSGDSTIPVSASTATLPPASVSHLSLPDREGSCDCI